MIRISRLVGLLFAILIAIELCADSKNPADYPLRLHVFTSSGVTFYRNRVPDESRGDGRANLFENSEPRGVDFSFRCSQKIQPSFGFETYSARWKKKNEELIVLFPEIGKANAYFTCTLKTELKSCAYFMRNGRLDSEPVEQFKAWMLKNDYDPERGKNTPKQAGATVVPTGLDEARQCLTGSHKDPEKARKLLLAFLQSRGADTSPEDLVWANIYLGYIEDRVNNRQNAIGWYEKAVAVDGAPPGSLNMARLGLRQPLVWIRHLDVPSAPLNQPPYRQ